MRMFRCWMAVAAFLPVAVLAGCDSAPKSYQVSGSVKLDGAPIPYGEVLFTPDAEEGNSGPQGIATIREGQYDTRWENGRGMPGGPMVIRVNGMSGPGGKTLCEYEMKVDLPRADTSHNIDVPKNGAVTPGKEI